MLSTSQTPSLIFSNRDELTKPDSRIILKALTSSDPESNHLNLIAWRNEPDIMKCFYGSTPISMETHLAWLAKVENDSTQMYFGVYATKNRDSTAIEPTFIGVAAISHIDHENSRTEYGRLLIGHHDFRKGGYGLETELMMIELVFENLKLNRFYLEAFTDNVAVINLHHKTGFKDEGVWKQHVKKDGVFKDVLLMGLLAEDYKARSAD